MKSRSSIAPLSLVLTIILLVLPAHVAHGQSPEGETQVLSTTQGLFLSPHFAGGAVSNGDTFSGAGGGIKLGYGFSPLFTLYAGFNFVRLDNDSPVTSDLAHLDIGGQFNFRVGEAAFVPYLDAALSGVGIFDEFQGESLETTGGGLSVGGGFKYFLQRNIAIDIGLQLGFMSLQEISSGGQSVDIDESISTARFNLGLSWFPMR